MSFKASLQISQHLPIDDARYRVKIAGCALGRAALLRELYRFRLKTPCIYKVFKLGSKIHNFYWGGWCLCDFGWARAYFSKKSPACNQIEVWMVRIISAII
jgi:hypothetical protein